MADITKYYAELTGNSIAFRETTVAEFETVLESVALLQDSLLASLELEPTEFTDSLIDGLDSATESATVLAETFQSGFPIDLTPLGPEGLLGQIDLLTANGIGALGAFFGALRDEASQTASWIAFSGDTLLAGMDIYLGKGEEKTALLLGQLADRQTMLDENRLIELGMQQVAQDERLAGLEGYLGAAYSLRESGLLAEDGLLSGFLDSGLGMLEDFASTGFSLRSDATADQVGLEKESQDAQNAVAEAGFMDKMNMASKLLGGLSSLMESESKEAFMIGKAAALAEAAVNTALGAIKAYTSLAGIPLVGPALGAVAAAAVVASGASTINDIRSQQFGGGSKPKSNFKPIKASTAAAPKLTSPTMGGSGASAAVGTSTGGGLADGGPTKVKVFVGGNAIIDTIASPMADGKIVVRAQAA
jgi:hypothetical protein